MFYTDLKDKIFTKASTKFDQCEIYINSVSDVSLQTYNDEVNQFEISETGGISFRGIVGNKEGYAYSEDISEGSIDFLINSAYQILESTDEKENIYIFKPEDKETFEKLTTKKNTDPSKMIKTLLAMNDEARKYSDEIHQVDSYYSEVFSKKYIANTYGVEKYEENQYSQSGCMVIIKKGEDMRTNREFRVANSFEDFDFNDMAKTAVELTEKDFGAKSVKSGKYDVILKDDIFASIILSLISSLSADSVQKNMSPFKKSDLESFVASGKLTILEKTKLGSLDNMSSFDGEGVYKNDFAYIDKGVLKTFAYNIETASKDGVETNASSRRSYKSRSIPSIGKIEIQPGSMSYDELVSNMKNGLVITSVQGLHSGLNAISGEFSLPCNGFLIEDGKEVRAVNQIIMSSNVKEILNSIEEIGNDMLNSGSYNIPSVWIKNINISGE